MLQRFAPVDLLVCLLAALAGLSGPACREAATRGPAAEPASVARPATPQPGASAGPAAASASTAPGPEYLTAPDRLTHLFEQLASLDEGHPLHDVVVLQYGDSHTASDYGVSVLRHTLQARFGEGGRGFVPIGRPWKTYGQEGVRGGMTQEFQPVMVTSAHAHGGPGDGSFGLLGVGLETSQPGARAWTEVTAHTSHVELAYLEQPLGGGFDVLVDGTPAGRFTTRGAQPRSAYVAFDVTDAPHTIEVRTLGDGVVRVYGLTLDRPEAGVVVDTLGINGAQISTPLHWSPDHFAEQLRHAAPDLVVLAYGTNEALEASLLDADYQERLAELLGRVARAAPGASCLLLGPPDLARRGGQGDWKTWPRILEIVAMQRRAAQAAGCAFYDQLAAMGGPGSMAAWASEPEPRAQGDRVHLTRSGYAQLATALATSLLHAYDEWRAERGLPHVAPKNAGVASR